MNIMNIGLTTAEIIKKAGLLSDMGGGSQQNFVGGAVGGALSGLQQNVTNIGGKQYIQNPDGTFKAYIPGKQKGQFPAGQKLTGNHGAQGVSPDRPAREGKEGKQSALSRQMQKRS